MGGSNACLVCTRDLSLESFPTRVSIPGRSSRPRTVNGTACSCYQVTAVFFSTSISCHQRCLRGSLQLSRYLPAARSLSLLGLASPASRPALWLHRLGGRCELLRYFPLRWTPVRSSCCPRNRTDRCQSQHMTHRREFNRKHDLYRKPSA